MVETILKPTIIAGGALHIACGAVTVAGARSEQSETKGCGSGATLQKSVSKFFTYLGNCILEAARRCWKVTEDCRKSRKVTESHGKSRKVTESHGKSRKVTESHGK